MREILFRGKCIDDTCLKGKWLEGDIIHDGVTGKHYINTENCLNESDIVGEEGLLRFVAYEVDPETVCQCTGLTDKNGRKIFEGDILRFEDCSNYPVVWDSDYCAFGSCWYSDFDHLSKYRNIKIEVVGNIFDNPGLLEE